MTLVKINPIRGLKRDINPVTICTRSNGHAAIEIAAKKVYGSNVYAKKSNVKDMYSAVRISGKYHRRISRRNFKINSQKLLEFHKKYAILISVKQKESNKMIAKRTIAELENDFRCEQDNGYDYEVTQRSVKNTVLSTSAEYKAIAKSFGGKALTGSVKQKNWAEQIRAGHLAVLSSEEAKMICKHEADFFKKSSFWIDNRDKSAQDFINLISNIVSLKNRKAEARAKEAELKKLTKESLQVSTEINGICNEFNLSGDVFK